MKCKIFTQLLLGITFFMILNTVNAFAEPHSIKLVKQNDTTLNGVVHNGFPIFIDSTDNKINKVIFKLDTQKIEILHSNALISYIPLLENNTINDTITYSLDYIKALTDATAPTIRIDCQKYGGKYDIYFRPLSHAKYNDARINNYPLEWSCLNVYTINLDSTELKIFNSPEYKHIKVTRPLHEDRIIDGIRTKDLYNFGDTIVLRNYNIQMLNITENDTLQYNILKKDDIAKTTLPNSLYHYINDKFNNNLILIEFFGSWCTPCRGGIIKLRDLYDNYSNSFNIITIICEYSNDFSIAKDFIKTHKISWPIIYECLGKGYNMELHIGTWPYYIICTKDGKLTYATSSTDDIIEYIMNYEEK